MRRLVLHAHGTSMQASEKPSLTQEWRSLHSAATAHVCFDSFSYPQKCPFLSFASSIGDNADGEEPSVRGMEEPSSPCLHGVLLLQCDQSRGVLGGREGSSEADRTLHLQVRCWLAVNVCYYALRWKCFGRRRHSTVSSRHFDTFDPFFTCFASRSLKTGDIWTKQNRRLLSPTGNTGRGRT